MAEIVVLGSLNMDLAIHVPRIPSPGETISGDSLLTSAGGKGANQAAACASLGMAVAMVGCVGQDDFGKRLRNELDNKGVDIRFIKERASTPTGTAMILVDIKGENCIVLSPGANQLVAIDVAIEELIRNAKLLLLQLEITPGIVFRAIEIASAAGVPVLLNPAPAIPLPPEIYPGIDYLIPNETEAAILTGVEVRDLASAEKAAKILLGRGTKTVVITLGKDGALLMNSKAKIHSPAFNVNVVDTTGAGDAFIGGIATALVEGKGYQSALEYASAAGALASTKVGAQTSLPNRQDLEAFLKQNTRIKEVA